MWIKLKNAWDKKEFRVNSNNIMHYYSTNSSGSSITNVCLVNGLILEIKNTPEEIDKMLIPPVYTVIPDSLKPGGITFVEES